MKNNRYVYSSYSDYLDQETNDIRPDFVDRLNEQDKEIKILKRALELACNDLRNLTKTYYKTTKQLSREYKTLAKENKL